MYTSWLHHHYLQQTNTSFPGCTPDCFATPPTPALPNSDPCWCSAGGVLRWLGLPQLLGRVAYQGVETWRPTWAAAHCYTCILSSYCNQRQEQCNLYSVLEKVLSLRKNSLTCMYHELLCWRSMSNIPEAGFVACLCHHIISRSPVTQSRIGIIAP